MEYSNLYPHNADAVEKVRQHFAAGNQRAAVVHATGTGKSFIIAEVAKDYDRVMIVAPYIFIIDEMKKLCDATKTIFTTYAAVSGTEEFTPEYYDLIVLDEFHHTGAKEWGDGVSRLIAANPHAKILGTSATHIRYLDNHRNMVNELFDGHIVSHLTLAEALNRGILPTPTYVSSIYSFDSIAAEFKERIESYKCSDSRKICRLAELERARLKWEESKGVPAILRKYITPDIHRAIMFAPSIDKAQRLMQMMEGWMAVAGIKCQFYSINCAEPNVKDVMLKFQADDTDSLKIAVGINMLNEGIHIDGVDCVIMLRNTQSRTIVEQQIGRCLTAKNASKPLILDFVNNVSISFSQAARQTAEADQEFIDEETPLFDSESNARFDRHSLPFRIIDECSEIMQILEGCVDHHSHDENEVIEAASKCTSLKEFRIEYPNLYAWVKVNRLLGLLGGLTRDKIIYSDEDIAETALLYEYLTDFRKDYPKMYSHIKSGHKYHLIQHLKRKVVHLTDDEIIAQAQECSTINELKEKKLYQRIIRRNLTYLLEDKRVYRTVITKEECAEKASQYSDVATFKRECPSFYACIQRNGWLDELTGSMSRRITHYTPETCREIAMQYSDYTLFSASQPKVLDYIRRHGLFDELTGHMKRQRNRRK